MPDELPTNDPPQLTMSQAFKTAVKTNVPRTARIEAIQRLVEAGERRNLAVLVRTSGLRGEFRRQAIDGLDACGGTDRLEELAEDRSLAPALRRRAEFLL